MKKIFLVLLVICASTVLKAQIHEVGLFLGGSNYIGDLGRENYIYPNNLAVGAFYKYNLNPRIALKGAFTYSNIKADDADAESPARNLRNYNFSNTIKELALGLEFNFFEYQQQSGYNYYTPYILVGIAASNYNIVTSQTTPGQYNYKSKTRLVLPFGLGYKTRLKDNIAIAFEVKARYTFNDDLDYNNFEIPALSFGNPNSDDWYVFSGISLIYAFGREACYAP